jgi:transposase-like protein
MSSSPDTFIPPHCPREHCQYHRCADGWRWIRHGHFSRQCEPRVIPRYRCLHCRATFSSQTFSTTYYLKRPELLEPIAHRIVACSGYRQIAREARCCHSTVMGQVARLGRHALLVLNHYRPRDGDKITEALVGDGFEGFAYSQYHPLYLNTIVGAESHYTYAFTHSRMRRKGRMTPAQLRRRAAIEAEHGRADPKAIETGTADAIRIAAPPQALIIRTDEHQAYPRAIRRLEGYTLIHEQTSSLDSRTQHNPLYAVNLLDLQLRHNSANHKRETIAFSKRHQAVIERGGWLMVWRNFCKHFSENRKQGTPAMRAGLTDTPWSVKKLLDGRRFATRTTLPKVWQEYYERRVDTPGIKNPRRHLLKLAF